MSQLLDILTRLDGALPSAPFGGKEARFALGNLSSKALELEAAKEILAEVFETTPSEVDEMIKQRLSELVPGADLFRDLHRSRGRRHW